MKLWPILLILLSSCSKVNPTYNHSLQKDIIKLCMIGDTGVGSKIQKLVAERLKIEGCDTTHFLGDIIYPRGIDSPEDPDFHKKFYDYYKDIGKKYLIMGNHDHRKSVGVWLELAHKHPDIFFPHPYYLVKINSLCLVHIDTNYYKLFLKFGTGFRQHLWLNQLSDELNDCSKKVVLAHHPYESRGDHHGPSTGLMRWFHNSNIIGKFDALIAGHEHILSDEGIVDGTRLLISGAGGNPREDEPAGFLVLKWDSKKKKIAYDFVKVQQ